MFKNPDNKEIFTLLANARTIAMVGASSKPDRASHGVMKLLQRSGYKIIPVNPNEAEILGEKVYKSLSDIPFPVDIVDVFRRAEDTPPIAAEAVKTGAKTFWLQLGIANEEAANTAQKAGMTVIMDRCIAVELGRLNVPPVPK